MGRSFYLGKDAELQSGSLSFSEKITATPTAYGLTAGQASAYAALDATWQAAYQAALDPATRTKAKVQAKNDARTQIKLMASNLAKIVEGTATVTNEQRLDLGLSVRATPSPVGAPGAATDFKATLDGNGSMITTWKCSNPTGSRGTFYNVWRKLDGGEFAFAGVCGSKKFVDNTIPAGTSVVTYQIQAGRTTAAGPWASFVVNFGMGGVTMVAQTQPVKMAA